MGPPSNRALGLLVAVATALAPAPAPAQVPASGAPSQDPGAAPPPAPISPEADMTAKEPPPPNTPILGKPLRDPKAEAEAKPQPTLVAPANNVSPTAGMGGRLMSADDPEARRAEAELEGTALAKKQPAAGVPRRLPPMQRAAWWCMFGTFALASTGGVFAGLAEVREDEAQRVAISLDLATGGQPLYEDARAEYERHLTAGRRDAAVAAGFLAASAGFFAAGVVLFAVHAARGRKDARLRAGAGGLQLRF
jgi:hypothetical protein